MSMCPRKSVVYPMPISQDIDRSCAKSGVRICGQAALAPPVDDGMRRCLRSSILGAWTSTTSSPATSCGTRRRSSTRSPPPFLSPRAGCSWPWCTNPPAPEAARARRALAATARHRRGAPWAFRPPLREGLAPPHSAPLGDVRLHPRHGDRAFGHERVGRGRDPLGHGLALQQPQLARPRPRPHRRHAARLVLVVVGVRWSRASHGGVVSTILGGHNPGGHHGGHDRPAAESAADRG